MGILWGLWRVLVVLWTMAWGVFVVGWLLLLLFQAGGDRDGCSLPTGYGAPESAEWQWVPPGSVCTYRADDGSGELTLRPGWEAPAVVVLGAAPLIVTLRIQRRQRAPRRRPSYAGSGPTGRARQVR